MNTRRRTSSGTVSSKAASGSGIQAEVVTSAPSASSLRAMVAWVSDVGTPSDHTILPGASARRRRYCFRCAAISAMSRFSCSTASGA